MAAVTINSLLHNVEGTQRQDFYTVTGINGSTLNTGFHVVRSAGTTNPGVVTSFTIGTTIPITVTFNSTGAFTALPFTLVGR